MAFFESSEALNNRMRPLWEKGVTDFKATQPAAKPLVGTGGAIGAVAGTVWSIPKTGGVAAYEYYDHSFGKSRGRDFFSYVTSSPVLHTIAFGAFAGLLGAGLHATGVMLPHEWGTATTFGAGVIAYLISSVSRTFPRVFWSNATGFTGKGLSVAKGAIESVKQPLDPSNVTGRRDGTLPPG